MGWTKKHELEINLCTLYVHITSVERVRTTATMARHFHFLTKYYGVFLKVRIQILQTLQTFTHIIVFKMGSFNYYVSIFLAFLDPSTHPPNYIFMQKLPFPYPPTSLLIDITPSYAWHVAKCRLRLETNQTKALSIFH